MSLLMFIESKYDMRKVFDPDQPQVIDEEEDLGDSGKTN